MSNQNPSVDYGRLPTAIRFALSQFLKRIATALPAGVASWSAATRRADLQPSIRAVMTDGSEVSRPVVPDVPMLFPSGGGYVLSFPMRAGDQVLRLACERGLGGFKSTHAESSPDAGVVLDGTSSVAIPGFGPLSIAPVSDGAALQTEDGSVYVEVHEERVRVRMGGSDVTLSSDGLVADVDGKVSVSATGDMSLRAGKVSIYGDVEIDGGTLRHNGVDVGSGHRHGQVKPGPGRSGAPA